jgi:Leucine-rich repeat (LRR) protein
MPHTPRRSLESLKKEAKRWLRELLAGDRVAHTRLTGALPDRPDTAPTLREVQHALARELGYEGWSALKLDVTQNAGIPSVTVTQYDEMAAALLDAFRSGTPEAMERHYQHTWHRRPWSGMRSYVLLDLGRRPDDAADISLDDARHLVATEYGFSDWTDLQRYVAAAPGNRSIAAKPVRVIGARPTALFGGSGDGHGGSGDVLGGSGDPPNMLTTRDWGEVLELLAEASGATLEAHGQMTDALLREIARCPGITSLNLGGSRGVTDEGLAQLARLPGLKHLDLSGTSITDRGLQVLEELTELETLSLIQTNVTDSGMAPLQYCDRLRRLNLMWTRIGDGAIRALAGKEHFTHLSTGIGVTDAGLEALAEIPGYAEWRGGDVEMGLTSYEPEPNCLMLRGPFTDRGMAACRRLEGLFGLNIDASELAVTGEGLKHLVDLPHLGWLAAAAFDDQMPVIAAMPHLRFLGCQDTPASDTAWVALGQSRSIEKIWGRRCHGLRTEGFLALSRMPSMRSLSVSCLNVEDRGLAALPYFPALRELMPMDVPDAGYRHIGRCREMDSLVLMYCRDTTDAAMEHLAGLPKLTKYFVSYNLSTDRTPEILAGIGSLESVTFDQCAAITDAGIQHLRRLPHLRELRAAGQRITAAAGAGFGPAVRVSIN